MIRFKEIWELYEKGKINDEQPLDAASFSRLSSKQGSEIADIIDNLVSFDPSSINKRISQANPENLEINSLQSLLEETETAESRARSFLNLEIRDYYLYGHLVRVIRAGDNYDKSVLTSFDILYEQFKKSDRSIQEARAVAEIESARKKADAGFISCNSILNIIRRRGIIDQTQELANHVEIYGKNKLKVDELAVKIASLRQTYSSLSLAEDCLKELQALKGKTRNKWYSKSTLVNDCISHGYKEGLSEIEGLQKEITYVTANLSSIRATLKKSSALTHEIDHNGINQERISDLIRLYDASRELHEHIRHNNLYYEGMSLQGRLRHMKAKCLDSIGAMYGQAKADASYDIKYVLQLYTAISEIANVDDRIQAIKALIVTREAQKRQSEQDRALSEAKERIRYLKDELSKANTAYQSKVTELTDKVNSAHSEVERIKGIEARMLEHEAELGREARKSLDKIQGMLERQNQTLENLYGKIESSEQQYNAQVAELKMHIAQAEDELRTNTEQALNNYEARLSRLGLHLDGIAGQQQRQFRKYDADFAKIQESLKTLVESWERFQEDCSQARESQQNTNYTIEFADGKAVIRPQLNNASFVLMDYLKEAPEPSSYSLLRLKDILEGRTGIEDPFERLAQFSNYLATMKPVSTSEDREFLGYLFQGLEREVIQGFTGRTVGVSSFRRGIVGDTLAQFRNYLAA